MITPINNTPPTPPPAAMIPILPESGPGVVDRTQSAWAVNDWTLIGQLGYTSRLLPWTRIAVWLPLTHCWIKENTCAQSGRPDNSARYKTTCSSLVQRKCSVLIWSTVNEHLHLELAADIMELVMSASFSAVLWNCKNIWSLITQKQMYQLIISLIQFGIDAELNKCITKLEASLLTLQIRVVDKPWKVSVRSIIHRLQNYLFCL